MRRQLMVSRKVVPLMLLAGLALPACSDDLGPMLFIDVSLDQGVASPTTVRLEVTQQGGPTLAQKTFTWTQGTLVLKAGMGLPKGATSKVMVSALGLDFQGGVLSNGSALGDISGTPIVVVLKSGPLPGDAGTDLPGTPADAENVEGGASDGAVTETGPQDAPTADAGTSDASVIDASVDAENVNVDGPVAEPDAAGDVPIGADVAAGDGAVSSDTGPAVEAGPSWSTPINLQQVAGDHLSYPSVAVEPDTGNAMVVWSNNMLGVKAAHYTAATDTWEPAVTLSNEVELYLARVAVDGSGHYVAVWTRDGDGVDAVNPGIWASFSSDGKTWSTPTQLAQGGANNDDHDLRIAMNRAGQARVVWDHNSLHEAGTYGRHLYSVYIEGTANQAATLVATGVDDDLNPRVAIDGNGNGIIEWNAPDTVAKKTSVWAATFAKGTVNAAALVESFDADNVRNSAVAMSSAGQGMVVWQQPKSSDTVELYARRYSAAGIWDTAPELITRAYWPGVTALALDGHGNAALAWSYPPVGVRYQATLSFRTVESSSWSVEAAETDDLAPDYTVTDVEPQVAEDVHGNVLLAWRKMVGAYEFAPHFRWHGGTDWTGPDVEVGRIADMFAEGIQVGVSDDGRHAVAAWTYYHCDPGSSSGAKVCPDGKQWADVSQSSQAAWGNVFVSQYR